MSDYVITDALVLDGIGIPPFKANVAVNGDRIASVSSSVARQDEKVIDAKGLILCPGFVDMHTHADVSVFSDPCGSSLALQGVTSVVLGNCGNSPAPLTPEVRKMWQQRLPWGEEEGRGAITWSTFEEYLSAIEKAKFSVNVAAQIGHNSIRSYVMGHYTKESTPTPNQMREMKTLVEDAMKAGAIGMSSGLMYTPGFYAKTEEIIELCKIVVKYGGIYSTHMRGEANELLQSVTEAVRIAEAAGISTEISHHRAECKVNWGLIRHTLKMMLDANRRGANITCDFFPYLACGVGGGIPLPRWASPLYMPQEEAGKIIKNPDTREKIKEQLRQGTSLGPEARAYEPMENLEQLAVTVYPGHPELQGKTMAELARISGANDPYDFYLDTVTSKQTFGVVSFNIWEEDLATLVKSPLAMIGTDSAFVDDINRPNRHPRAYGSFPIVLGKYTREEKLISCEEAVMKMSSRPNAKLGIFDRGLIRPGFFADLVLFNPTTVTDKGDYSGKANYPQGIEYVFVNGEPIVIKGQHTKATPGRLLRHH